MMTLREQWDGHTIPGSNFQTSAALLLNSFPGFPRRGTGSTLTTPHRMRNTLALFSHREPPLH